MSKAKTKMNHNENEATVEVTLNDGNVFYITVKGNHVNKDVQHYVDQIAKDITKFYNEQ